ncbi:MAG: hypothetical protein OXQ29_11930 [Rhodospirillaceae bacterium]|nr:hypothetical protein [Rhodospirillaceae bacterium]
MADLVGARNRIDTIAHTWSVQHHGVVATYPAPPDSYKRLRTPSVVIANVGLPSAQFFGGHIEATYSFSVDWLFGSHEASAFESALQALPLMIEDLSTDLALTTICTGALTVVGGDPAVGLFEFDGKQFFAARVVVNCGFVDVATVS